MEALLVKNLVVRPYFLGIRHCRGALRFLYSNPNWEVNPSKSSKNLGESQATTIMYGRFFEFLWGGGGSWRPISCWYSPQVFPAIQKPGSHPWILEKTLPTGYTQPPTHPSNYQKKNIRWGSIQPSTLNTLPKNWEKVCWNKIRLQSHSKKQDLNRLSGGIIWPPSHLQSSRRACFQLRWFTGVASIKAQPPNKTWTGNHTARNWSVIIQHDGFFSTYVVYLFFVKDHMI